MARKRIAERTQRVAVDPVTHERTVTALDDVQKALERIAATLDRELLRLDAASGDRLLGMVVEAIRLRRRRTD